MNKLDFLSEAPKTLIFQHNSNKSNFGGVLTLIYIIIVLFIAFSFIYDYETGLKYSVIYSYNEEYLDEESIKRKLQDESYNPEITYKFGMYSKVNTSNFFIYLKNQNEFINFGEERKSKVYSFNAYIGYKCSKLGENDYDCSLKENDKSPDIIYYFYIKYTSTKIVHEDEEFPLQKKFIPDYFYFSFGEVMNYYYQKWKTIKYTEDKGIFGALNFGKSKEYYGGVMLNDKIAIADMPEDFINEFKIKGMKILCGIQIHYYWANFLENYTRSKKTILEPISNICSLSLTIYSIFIFIYCGFFLIISIITKLSEKYYQKIKERF